MKYLSILLLFISTGIYAQNWKTTAVNDTMYFRGGTHGPGPFQWNYSVDSNIVKVAFVIGTSTSLSDTTYHFFHSLRDTNLTDGYTHCVDTASDSWLGPHVIHALNGMEYYFNSKSDTIRINTLAMPGDEWILAEDVSGIVYKATLSQAGITMVEGVQDSFKTITIQAFQNGIAVANSYNTKVLEWSKEHGWLRALDLYVFPNVVYTSAEHCAVTDFVQLERLDSFSRLDINYIDLQWKYAPGNEWIHEIYSLWYGGFGQDRTFLHDSVESSYLLNPNQIVAHIKTNKNFDGVTSTYYHTDTITANLNPIKISDTILPEYARLPLTSLNEDENFTARYFVSKMCNSKYLIKWHNMIGVPAQYDNGCLNLGPNLSGGAFYGIYTLYGFGEFGNYYQRLEMGGVIQENSYDYPYMKLQGCIYGEKFDVLTVGIQNVAPPLNAIKLYPNPAREQVTVESLISDENAVISINDITGKVIYSQKGLDKKAVLDVKEYSAGIYFIIIKSAQGNFNEKFVITE